MHNLNGVFRVITTSVFVVPQIRWENLMLFVVLASLPNKITWFCGLRENDTDADTFFNILEGCTRKP